MFYFDQSGFTLMPVVPYAWQARGQTLTIPSTPSPRLNVVGLISPAHQSYFQTVTGAVTSATAIAVLDAFAAQTAQAKKLRLVVLDNAPHPHPPRFPGAGDGWVPPGRRLALAAAL